MNALGIFWKFITTLVGVGIGLAEAIIIGGSILFFFFVGVPIDVIVVLYYPTATWLDREIIGAAFEEIAHMIVAAVEEADESDAEQKAEAERLEREHRTKVYLYGDVSVGDALTLAASAYFAREYEPFASVFEAGRGLLELFVP